jgi:sodium-dependent dicarboxylate transporter 2/3/5
MNWKRLILLATLAIAAIIVMYTTNASLFQSDKNYWNAVALGSVMVILWVFELIPIYVTALIPLIAGVPLGLIDSSGLAAAYGDKMVYLFLGGFILALALEKWNIHVVVANKIINFVGHSKPRILFGFLMATGFLSMWVSNTATALMMLPMAVAIIELLPKDEQKNRFAVYILLSVAYGANIGGMATLVGSPPNLQMASMLSTNFDTKVTFFDWFKIGFPVSIFMLLLAYLFFWLTLGKERNESIVGYKKQQHRLSIDQWKVVGVFLFVVVCWIFKDIIAGKNGFFPNLILSDESVAIFGAVLLILLPASKQSDKKTLLTWKDTEQIPWGILIMFGGGLALAACLSFGGVIDSIALLFKDLGNVGYGALLILMVVIAVFGTELLSNLALVTLFVPIIAAFSIQNNMPLVNLCIPLTLAASCGFMMPVGTPPNAIAFSSGLISMRQMVLNGLVINIIGMLTIILAALFFYGG